MMFNLTGFRVLELLMRNDKIQIFRVERIVDQVRMIAKTTSDTLLASHMIADFQVEYEQLLRLKGQGGLIPYSFDLIGERPVLLFRDFAGSTLSEHLRVRRDRDSLELPQLLDVAIACE